MTGTIFFLQISEENGLVPPGDPSAKKKVVVLSSS